MCVPSVCRAARVACRCARAREKIVLCPVCYLLHGATPPALASASHRPSTIGSVLSQTSLYQATRVVSLSLARVRAAADAAHSHAPHRFHGVQNSPCASRAPLPFMPASRAAKG